MRPSKDMPILLAYTLDTTALFWQPISIAPISTPFRPRKT